MHTIPRLVQTLLLSIAYLTLSAVMVFANDRACPPSQLDPDAYSQVYDQADFRLMLVEDLGNYRTNDGSRCHEVRTQVGLRTVLGAERSCSYQ